jgi:hypothetical protein
MQYHEGSIQKSILSFQDFGIELKGREVIKKVNLELNGNYDILLFSRNTNISLIPGLFIFDIFDYVSFSGKLFHKGVDVLDLLIKIKKFRINGNRIGIASRLLDDVFSIPGDPIELFDPELKISTQILDFVPYNTRIETLNGIVRREMIKLTEIKDIIRQFDEVEDKHDYTILKCMDFGLLGIYNNIYKALSSSSGKREDELSSLIIKEKTGVNLADIVVLRNYYRYRLNYDELNGKLHVTNIERKNDGNVNKEIKRIQKKGKKDFDFISFNLTRSYSENILKNATLELVENYMKLMGISYDADLSDKFPSDVPISHIYKLLVGMAFITGKNSMVIDLSLYPMETPAIAEYVRRLKSIQQMACLYVCTKDEVAKNADKVFDSVIEV